MSDRACTLPRTTGDLYVEVSDGRFTAMTLATPADIAAAHPKCGECEWCKTVDVETHIGHTTKELCTNEDSPYNRNSIQWIDGYYPYFGLSEVNPTTDYCPHHSEIQP